MTIHYRFTDTKGRTHTRTSRGHVKPQFTHGVVGYHRTIKRAAVPISFCGRHDLAAARAAEMQRTGYTTEICAVEASERPSPEMIEAKRKRADAAKRDLAQLRSDEESERRGLAMMSGDLEG